MIILHLVCNLTSGTQVIEPVFDIHGLNNWNSVKYSLRPTLNFFYKIEFLYIVLFTYFIGFLPILLRLKLKFYFIL